ncbi:flagellar motor switch protein FliM [Thorsellia kenyensis]|uniref:Flagellar motor switch protein FliM n=1 Tax=Thorsellia kenyensis TaxID=1549888 RepID=A0ABV6CAL3_9GAMM
MTDDILSQEEIDALLGGGKPAEEKNADNAKDTNSKGIKKYDPATQRRVVRERLQALEIINERFVRQLRIVYFNLFRRSPEITLGPLKTMPYHEFAKNLPVPTNLNLVNLKPLRGSTLFVFSPSLVFIAVDNLFGGDGRFPTRVEGREFTPTEQRVIKRLLKLALEAYSDCWSAVYKIEPEFVRSESQIKFTNITSSPNDIVVTTDFNIELGNAMGEFSICIPFAMIEPIRELLKNPPLENSQSEDELFKLQMKTELKSSKVELNVDFVNIPIRVNDILTLKKGDILPIDKPDLLTAYIDGVPVLTGKYGNHNGQYAIKVQDMMDSVLKKYIL